MWAEPLLPIAGTRSPHLRGANGAHGRIERHKPHMATFEKREKEKKRLQKQEEKKRKKEERKANSPGGGLERPTVQIWMRLLPDVHA